MIVEERNTIDGNGSSCSSEISSTTDCPLMYSNSSAIITCAAQGSTPLELQLINNMHELQHASNTNYLQHMIDKPSAAIYQCMASNEYGSRQTTIYISLPGKYNVTLFYIFTVV